MNIKTNLENNDYLITLSGRLDSTSVGLLEEIINDDLKLFNSIYLDFSSVEYVSSAGLRAILKIKKLNNNTSVINTNNDVYEIFSMTGFSEMMTVKKALRQIDVDGCEVVGKGAIGTVYRIADDTIVKVFLPGYSIEDIDRERELARKAFVLGVPTAIAYDVVKVGDNLGAVFELLNAKTLSKMMIEDTKNIDKYIELYANVLKVIQASELKPGELTNAKVFALNCLKSLNGFLTDEVFEKTLSLVEGINEDNYLVHGDYHIKNLMIQDDEPFIIDMDTLKCGSHIFEFAYMYSCYCGYQEIKRENGLRFFGLPQETLEYIFDKTIDLVYPSFSIKEKEEFIKKARILSYLQLLPRFIKEGDKPSEIELFKKELSQLVFEIDTLNV